MDRPAIGIVIHTALAQRLFSPEDRARLQSLGHVTWTDSPKPISVDEAIAIVRNCDIGVGSWSTPYPDAALTPACPRLRLWVHAAGTVRHMFGPHLAGRDITIASCAPAIADNVAATTVGIALVAVKRIFENALANRRGPVSAPADSRNLWSCTVGVIGASQVGRRVMRLLRQFECPLLLYDPYVTEGEAAEMGVTLMRDLTALCAASDVVTLHAPSLPSTRHMLSATQFQAMRDGAVFINTARGACVDEAALVAECRKGRITAWLDVTDPEPAAADSPLRSLANVFLTSHLAGGADYRIGRQAVDDIEAFLRGGRPKMVVTVDMLDRVA